ncbi:MAG: hypothetical protein PHT40_02895 [Patescibacteria group bacterium]|nr:hypothetical protein [Patescibacteria group bacterium]
MKKLTSPSGTQKKEEQESTIGELVIDICLTTLTALSCVICFFVLGTISLASLGISLPSDLCLVLIAFIISFNKQPSKYPEFGKFPITKFFWKPFYKFGNFLKKDNII